MGACGSPRLRGETAPSIQFCGARLDELHALSPRRRLSARSLAAIDYIALQDQMARLVGDTPKRHAVDIVFVYSNISEGKQILVSQ